VKRLCFLDFDGCLVDTAYECAVVAWCVRNGIDSGFGAVSVEPGFLRQFYVLKPFIRYAREYHVFAADAYASIGDEDSLRSYLASEASPEELKAYETRFYETREAIKEESFEYWLSLNKPYAFAVEALRMIAHRAAIVSGKDRKTIEEILAVEQITPLAVCDFSYAPNKAAAVRRLTAERSLDAAGAVFLDDNLDHLMQVREAGVDPVLASWGYVSTGQRAQAEEGGVAVATEENLRTVLGIDGGLAVRTGGKEGRPVVLVTGSAGFLGGHLVRRLLEGGRSELYSIDRKSRVPLENEVFVQGDLAETAVYEGLPRVDLVFHLAAQSSARVSLEDPFQDLHDNIMATLTLLEYCRRYSAAKIVFTSSMGVYGNAKHGEALTEESPLRPQSVYGAHKIAAEQYLRVYRQFGLRYSVLRLFNVYGPGQDMDNLKQGMVSVYLRYIHDGSELPVTGSLDRYRDFVFVDDVVDALALAGQVGVADDAVLNIGAGERTTVRTLIDMIAAEHGYAPGTYPVREVAGHPGDVLGNVAGIDRARSLGWYPKHSLADGIRKMVEWLRRGPRDRE
jgi:UDP-glucose 4-epimerase